MDIQWYVTDKELEGFPEERSDQISKNIIKEADNSLSASKAKQKQQAHTALKAS